MCTSTKTLGPLLVLLGTSLFGQIAQAKYGGGSGTADDPYQIATAEDLIALGETPADYDKHFILTADIDLAGHVFNKAVIAPDTDPEKDYYQGIPFTGVLDGNGHAISHLTIVGQRYLGFFGRLDSAASVANLGLEAVEVNGTGNLDVGGLAGGNLGRITQCYSSGSVSGPDYVGGLVGYNSPGASIAASYARGMVSGDRNVGGLVGRNYGTITSSYSTGTVSGAQYVGGLVGFNDYFSRIVSSYSTGAVRGDRNVGGLVGHNSEGSVTQCYSTGAVSGTGGTVGGLVGSNLGDVTASFWDIQTSGQAKSAGGTGKTTAEMQDINTFLDGGWDFVDEVLNGTCDYWQISPGGYPQLRWRNGDSPLMPEGLGTAEQPYLIRDARDLGTVWFEPMAHYRLQASVDLSGITWSMAVIPWFGGLFDGKGHTISQLTIQGGSYLGLFGYSGTGAEVKNLGVVDVNIASSGGDVGGLVAYNYYGSIGNCYITGAVRGTGRFIGGLAGYNSYAGTVTNCYSNGTVSGDQYVGGLVGYNHYAGTVTNCYSTAAVDGNDYIGGLVGSNGGEVARCYSTGVVRGKNNVGGLVGSNGGNVNQSYSTAAVDGNGSIGGLVGSNSRQVAQCYSTGAVSGNSYVGGLVGYTSWWVFGCFWDIQTSGQTTSVGGTGKTTVEMQMASTFFGWGCTPTVWTIDDGVDYPRLAWESKPGKALTALAEFIEGSGSEADPYLICTGDDLNRIGLFVFDWDKHFKLMADIDLSGFDGINGRPAFNTIAPGKLDYLGYFKGTPFTGVFDGNGHEIQNLTVIVADGGCAGLIGGLGGGGEVKDLGVVDVNIASSGGGVGGLVGVVEWGWSSSGGSVKRCYSTGIVLGDYYVGGLVGINRGTITQCHSDAFVSGNGGSVGGLLGTNGGYVSVCYSIGTVSGDWSVGGLVGSNGVTQEDGWEGEVIDCYSTAEVRGTGEWGGVGGLVGTNDGSSIIHCYSTGAVSGTGDYVGGLVGGNWGGDVTRCYSTGAVNGTSNVGGLVGENYRGSITTSYSTGAVTGVESVGGLVGGSELEYVTGCLWDVQTSGQTTSAGGTGKTTAEMQMASTFLGWGCTPAVWTIDEGVDYPRLAWEGKPGKTLPALADFVAGSGTQDDPYLISTGDDLNKIGLFLSEWDKHFKLIADIDMSAFDGKDGRPPFDIIGRNYYNPFIGVFDGNGHTISHLTVQGKHRVGLFGQLGEWDARGAEVKNLGLMDVNITASGGYVGALVGENYGAVSRCYSTASVSSTGYGVGGLVGENYGTVTQCYSTGAVSGVGGVGGLVGENYGTVTQCYSTGVVSSDGSRVGGLVGENYGTVTQCYSTSAVSGTGSSVGGLVGYNNGNVTRCYSTGAVSGKSDVGGLLGRGWATASFWDMETSGQATSAGGTGKRTAEMQMAGTFAEAGWDFVGETANGTEDIWAICEGVDYPHLAWEFVIGDFDADADTDFADFCILAAHWLAADGSFWCGGGGTDLTNDGNVDFADLKVFADNWLAGLAP